MTQRFILASGSPRRRELLTDMGITFTVIKPDIEEKRRAGETPIAYVTRLSREKALAVSARLDQGADEAALILAADTTVILAADTLGVEDGTGEILEKPASVEDARAMLTRLRGRPHTVATALTLLKKVPGAAVQLDTRVTQSIVYMRQYSDAEMDAYITSGGPFDKAGGYAIQDEVFHPAERYEGSYTNIVGLPVETLKDMLTAMGVG
ncbi:MAG: Maf family protein [Anaerolineae bacterium]